MSIVGMRNFMKGRMQYIMLALAVVFAIGMIGVMIGTGGARTVLDDTGGVIAKVNGQKIERVDFEQQFQKETEQTEDTRVPSAYEEAQMRGRLFDRIVNQMLRVQAAEKAGVKVRRGEVKAKINEYIDMRISQLKEQVLANQKGKKTDEAFDAEMRRSGMSISQIKADLRKAIDPDTVREQILIEKHLAKLKEGIDTSDRAFRESFDEVRLAQITIGAKSRSMTQAEQRAKDILAKLRGGEDFAKLAREYSEDSLSAAGGAQVSFVRKESIPGPSGKAVFRLKAGEVGGPVKVPDGYAIVKVLERRSTLPPDFNNPQKRKEYRDQYLQQEQYRLLSELENNMRSSAGIVIDDPEIKGYMVAKDIGSYFGPGDTTTGKTKVKQAIREFEKAAGQSTGDSQALARCYSHIAYLYYMMGKLGVLAPTPQEKIEFRKKAVESVNEALKYTESNDLRMMLADLYTEGKDYDKALTELKYMSDNEFYDHNTHAQILKKYEELRSARPEVVAQRIADERRWIADYEKRMQEAQKAQQAQRRTQPFRVDPSTRPGG